MYAVAMLLMYLPLVVELFIFRVILDKEIFIFKFSAHTLPALSYILFIYSGNYRVGFIVMMICICDFMIKLPFFMNKERIA